jgi:H+/Na+-translocating ferredoxin:NAD+ oxidoreductase subunit G
MSMCRTNTLTWAPGALAAIAALPATPAHATTYLSVEAAQRALFPQAQTFEAAQVIVSEAQWQAIVRLAGPQAPHGLLRVWTARSDDHVLGHVFVDEVVGRQDFITYAVGIDTAGKLRPVEVMEYRESHGGEIRNRRWLAQFGGRSRLEQLRFGADIKNIAGATLSSEHVTSGVRRIVALWQTVLSHARNAAPAAPGG